MKLNQSIEWRCLNEKMSLGPIELSTFTCASHHAKSNHIASTLKLNVNYRTTITFQTFLLSSFFQPESHWRERDNFIEETPNVGAFHVSTTALWKTRQVKRLFVEVSVFLWDQFLGCQTMFASNMGGCQVFS